MKRKIARYFQYFLRGFARMLWGAATACIIVGAIIGFVSVANDGGYVAVIEFVGSVSALGLAVGSVYRIGR